MHWIDYECPQTLDAAVALFQQHGENARALAGGTDLLVQMKSGHHAEGVVIDVKKVPDRVVGKVGYWTDNGAYCALRTLAPAATRYL